MKYFLTIVLLLLISAGCTERVTKQFISEESDSSLKQQVIDNWVISPPKLVAYTNKRLDQIEDIPYYFWLTLKTNSIKKSQAITCFLLIL